jgi:hypothetical protein
VWVAGVVPNRNPLRRARRWDGVVPIAPGGGVTTPQDVADYLVRVPAPADESRTAPWDVVVHWGEGIPAQEYADAGVTWLVVSTWPTQEGWVKSMRRVIGSAL